MMYKLCLLNPGANLSNNNSKLLLVGELNQIIMKITIILPGVIIKPLLILGEIVMHKNLETITEQTIFKIIINLSSNHSLGVAKMILTIINKILVGEILRIQLLLVTTHGGQNNKNQLKHRNNHHGELLPIMSLK